MPHGEVQFRRRAGTPEQLEKGEAARLNEAVAAIPEPEEEAPAPPPEGVPQGVEAALPPGALPPAEPTFRPRDEEEEFLFGPTARPTEPIMAGLTRAGRVQPPPELIEAMPDILEAAAEPTAPQQLRDLAALLLYHLGE